MLSVEQANSLDTSSATQMLSYQIDAALANQTGSRQDNSLNSAYDHGRRDGGGNVLTKENKSHQNPWN